MKTIRAHIVCPVIALGLLLCTGCGKPPASAGGPPDDYAVRAVVALVEPEVLEERIGLVGTLRSPHAIDMVSELNARVEELLFREGQTVTNGQVLVRLRDDHIRARLREAEARYDLANANFKRGQDLLESETISPSDFDRLVAEFSMATAMSEQIRTEWADTLITSPLNGELSERKVSVGQYVTQGQVVTTVVQLDPLEAAFSVPERYLSQLAIGQSIRIQTAAYPGQIFEGRVIFIDPRVNEETRTVLMKAAIENPEGLMRPGMFVNLDLVIQTKQAALLIPESAVQYRGEEAVVMVMDEEDRAEIRRVATGTRVPERVEITEGLQAGDRVVVEGYQKMGPGTAIEIAPASARYGLPLEPPSPTPPST